MNDTECGKPFLDAAYTIHISPKIIIKGIN